ncbi:MAG: ribonuclease III [Bacteroidetes bacterium]|nr:ribonuclease III [Bacteroidota bacterium]
MLGFYPRNLSLYKLAFSHRSQSKDVTNGIKHSNERLEYLGDAILGAVIAEMLFRKFPFKDEGFLTEMRSRLVSRDHLKHLAVKLGINQFLKKNNNPDSFRNMYGDALEALIGAIYMDRGYAVVRKFILQRIIEHHVDLEAIFSTETNFKSRILNWAQRNKHTVVFETFEDENANDKLIRVKLMVNGQEVATAMDFVKKKAEQIAAEKACLQLQI